MKLWGGRFTKTTHQWVEAFNASIGFDKELAEEDIEGSMAHVKMLGACGIITGEKQTGYWKVCQPSGKKSGKGKPNFPLNMKTFT